MPDGPPGVWSKSLWMLDTQIPGGETSYEEGDQMGFMSPEEVDATDLTMSKVAWQAEVAAGFTTLGYAPWCFEQENEFGCLRMQFEKEARAKE